MNLIHWIIGTLSIIVAAYLIPGVSVTFTGALILAVVLALINIFIKPLVLILALPINILTLGLFSLVINAVFVMLAAKIVPDFAVAGFWPAFWFSILVSLVTLLFGLGVRNK